MLILGINGGIADEMDDEARQQRGHDSAAVLVNDGEILAAIEEERLSRVPHCNYFPRRAIRRCIEDHGLRLSDLQFIAVNVEEHTCDLEVARRYLTDPGCQVRSARQLYAMLFEREFGVDVARKLRFCNHHLAHAWSAYGASGFGDALVVVLDNEGDFAGGGVYSASAGHLTALRDYRLDQSLGRFYSSVIRLLGFHEFDHHKAAALAPYGDPLVYRELFSGLYQLLPKGNYYLVDRLTCIRRLDQAGLVDTARRRGEAFTQRHAHIAAALQETVETVVGHVVRHFREAFGHRRLCLAGALAQNCRLNAQLLHAGLFSEVFVQPAAHDAGGALGAALAVLQDERARERRAPLPPRRLTHLALGTGVEARAEVARGLQAWDDFIRAAPVTSAAHCAATLIAQGQMIGWVQGRAEFGPRGLGQRSILADPRPAAHRDRVNRLVKLREGYRPLAPSVQQERLADFFELPATAADFSFMTFALTVREPMRPQLAAVTHVDGRACVHAVSREHQPLYWSLIEEFGRHTGVHALLNTSFNCDTEPIVDSLDDAVVALLTSGLDALIVGDYLVRRREADDGLQPFERLVPDLPPSRKLVLARHLAAPGMIHAAYRIEGTMDRVCARPSAELQTGVWQVLLRADGRRPLAALLDEVAPEGDARHKATTEVLRLWRERLVALKPDGSA